jgi:hypothetical protein
MDRSDTAVGATVGRAKEGVVCVALHLAPLGRCALDRREDRGHGYADPFKAPVCHPGERHSAVGRPGVGRTGASPARRQNDARTSCGRRKAPPRASRRNPSAEAASRRPPFRPGIGRRPVLAACHAGGRGFESRRSVEENILQIQVFCCQSWRKGPPASRRSPALMLHAKSAARRTQKALRGERRKCCKRKCSLASLGARRAIRPSIIPRRSRSPK